MTRKTSWTPQRLVRLFRHYNARYWRGKLRPYTVVDKSLTDCLGFCNRKKLLIEIDVAAHRSDRDVRSTLLHEMAHAADGSMGRSHGYGFWRELERLLRARAPIEVGYPEMPGHVLAPSAIPRRFQLCRRTITRSADRRNRELLRGVPKSKIINIDDDDIVGDFDDAATSGLTWKKAYWAVGLRNGLIDVEGNPVDDHAQRVIAEGKSVHRRTRQWILADRRKWSDHADQVDSESEERQERI